MATNVALKNYYAPEGAERSSSMDFFDKKNENELLAVLGVNVFNAAEYTGTQLHHLFGFVCADETAEEEEEAWDIFPAFTEI